MAVPRYLALAVLAVFASHQVEAKSLKEIHELLTPEERDRVFSGPFPNYNEINYEVTHPTQVDADGNYLSSDLSHGNQGRKRTLDSGGSPEPAFFRVPAFGKELHVRAALNSDLFAPNFAVHVIGKDGLRVNDEPVDHCHYVGHVLSSANSKAAFSNCDGLSGVVQSDDHGLLVINPLPERLGLNKDDIRAHVIYRRDPRDMTTMARDIDIPLKKSKLCGVEDPPIDKREVLSDESSSCVHMAGTRYIETLVVADYNMAAFHGTTKLNIYVPTILNVAYSLIGDNSIGADIKYKIKKLQIHEVENANGLVISTSSSTTLSNFCQWSKGQNVGDDTNQDHFDHATLIARKSFVKADGSSVLGLASLKGMCNPDLSCTINQDMGLGSAFTIAHETGHNLGAKHDGATNTCPSNANIMATSASGQSTAFEWSACSCKYVTDFLKDTTLSSCLNDSPVKLAPLPTNTQLPGQIYDRDEQCKMMIPGSTGFCTSKESVICTQLWCTKTDLSCTTKVEPAVDGTICGTKKWCRRGACVDYGSEGPQAIDGGYSAWSNWGACSHTCGGGVIKRTRQCNSPTPQHGGKQCSGSAAEYKYCNTAACAANAEHTRTSQCKQKGNSVVFSDGMTYEWRYDSTVFPPSVDAERCLLKCVTGDSSSGYKTYTFGKVSDGTRCDGAGFPGMCINGGTCERLGCDNVLGSSAVEDRCGTCNGDGSGCSWSNHTFTKSPDQNGDYLQDVGATIPAGAKNIHISEDSGLKNVLALAASGGQQFNTNMNSLSYYPYTFTMAGTQFKYESNSAGLDKFTAKGPLTESVSLKFLVADWNAEYKVSVAYLVSNSAVSVREAKPFVWNIRCSVTCGEGTTEAVCTRADDESPVADQLCPKEKPGPKKCGMTPCPAQQGMPSPPRI